MTRIPALIGIALLVIVLGLYPPGLENNANQSNGVISSWASVSNVCSKYTIQDNTVLVFKNSRGVLYLVGHYNAVQMVITDDLIEIPELNKTLHGNLTFLKVVYAKDYPIPLWITGELEVRGGDVYPTRGVLGFTYAIPLRKPSFVALGCGFKASEVLLNSSRVG